MNGKITAIIAYVTWIGLIIAFLINLRKKNDFARFHIKQNLLIALGGFLIWMPLNHAWLWGAFLLLIWILGLFSAIIGKKQPLIFLKG